MDLTLTWSTSASPCSADRAATGRPAGRRRSTCTFAVLGRRSRCLLRVVDRGASGPGRGDLVWMVLRSRLVVARCRMPTGRGGQAKTTRSQQSQDRGPAEESLRFIGMGRRTGAPPSCRSCGPRRPVPRYRRHRSCAPRRTVHRRRTPNVPRDPMTAMPAIGLLSTGRPCPLCRSEAHACRRCQPRSPA